MGDRFPRAYQDSVKQDDAKMVYPNGGDFGTMGIGARKSGQPKGDKAPTSSGMGLDHVGEGAGGKK